MSDDAKVKALDAQIGRVMETVQAVGDLIHARLAGIEDPEERWMHIVASEVHLRRWMANCSEPAAIASMIELFEGDEE